MNAMQGLVVQVLAVAMVAAGAANVAGAESPGGRVTGTVKDQSGGVLSGGKIVAVAVASTGTAMVATDQQGRYVIDGLAAGRYRITAMASGFDPSVRDEVSVGSGRETVADFVLTIAHQESSVVVTAPASTGDPMVVTTDPRAPRQPVPAHDGADYLKAIPGFSVIRKGGSDGDPVLRGMSGSRLGILLDGQQILGGCGGRMDPPTAYVFPAAYDRITVLKGPQTVRYAAGTPAGTVLFERNLSRAAQPRIGTAGSLTTGSFGRHDEMVDVRAAVPAFYVQGSATRSHAGDYTDGSGASVHSLYTRWSGNAALGWTPNDRTRLEISSALSDGQTAYADRTMDSARAARDNVAIKLDRGFSSSSVFQRIEIQSYYNYIDHVMDNYSLRTPGKTFSAMNPDRQTVGGRAAATLTPGHSTTVTVGADAQQNIHTSRTAMNKTSAAEAAAAYQATARLEDMRFSQIGLFGEATRALTPRSRLVGGARADWHEALDSRACVNAMMCPGTSPARNDTRGATDRRTLGSGFGRYERDLDAGGLSGRFSIGLGHGERFPDYWERLKQDPTTLKSAFLSTRPEKTTQMDTGMVWRATSWSGSVSAFYGVIQDYVLIRWQPTPAVSRNVDATTAGAEASVAWTVTDHLKTDATLAFVRSDNTTDHKPLAQQPPAEARLGLTYDSRRWSLGLLTRAVAAQERVDVGSGSIVSNGMDIGPTRGFFVVSLNGGYRLKQLLVTAGVDNLLDATYAEHISQAGAAISGFVQTTRINEPGRTVWLKMNVDMR